MIKDKDPDIWVRRSTLFVLFAGAAIFAAWMLCARGTGVGWMDDYAYSLTFEPQETYNDVVFFCYNDGERINSLRDSLVSSWWHYQVVNARLANMLMFFYWHLPVWLAILLQGLCYGAMVAGIMKLASGKEWLRRPLALVLIMMFAWAVFPWDDLYASADYMLNYVWSGAACVWSLWAVLNYKSKLRWLWLVIPAAMMHEGLSAATDVGMLVHVLLHRKMYFRHPRRVVLPLAFALFSLVILLSPSTFAVSASKDWSNLNSEFFLRSVLYPNVVMLAVAVVYLVQYLRGKHYKCAAIYLSVMATSIAISFVSVQTGRALWMAYIMSAVMLVQMCARIRLGRRPALGLAGVLTALLCFWGYQVCAMQWSATCEREAVKEELRRGHPEGRYVLQNVTSYKDVPWWMFGVPEVVLEFRYYQQYVILKEAIGDGIKSPYDNFAVLPPAEDLESSIASMPVLSSGLRGDLKGFVSDKRAKDARIMMYFEGEDHISEPGWHPMYLLRSYKGRIPRMVFCMEMELHTQSGDTLWYYRPWSLPRPLWGRRLIEAYVCE